MYIYSYLLLLFRLQQLTGQASLPRKRVRRIPDFFNLEQGILATAHSRQDTSQLDSASHAAASLDKSAGLQPSDRQTTSNLPQIAGAVSRASEAANGLLERTGADAGTALLQPTLSESGQPRPTCQSRGACLDEPARSGAAAIAALTQLPALDFRNHVRSLILSDYAAQCILSILFASYANAECLPDTSGGLSPHNGDMECRARQYMQAVPEKWRC